MNLIDLLLNERPTEVSLGDGYMLPDGTLVASELGSTVAPMGIDWFFGVVVDSYPALNNYIVQGAGLPRTLAVPLSSSPAGPLGSQEAISLTIGCNVILMKPRDDDLAYIVGVLPEHFTEDTMRLPDFICQSSKTGMYANPAYHFPLLKEIAGTLIDSGGNRPADILPGDWVRHNELGLMFLMGQYVATMRASDVCKSEAFYLDNLFRVWAWNWEHYTAGSEERALLDGSYWSDVRTFTPYLYERLGLPSPGQAYTDTGSLKLGESAAIREPATTQEDGGGSDDQEGLWRVWDIGGFLGNILRRIVAKPSSRTPQIVTKGDDADSGLDGVADDWTGPDGVRVLRSAKGIILAKTPYIAVPTKKHEAEDPEGATQIEPSVVESFLSGIDPNLDVRALRGSDWYAYLTNYLARAKMTDVGGDWLLPDESEVGIPESGTADPYITGDVYPEGVAFIMLTDDGSIVLESAQGSQIIIAEDITLAPARDLVQRPRRNIIALAPEDVLMKAYKNFEISTATGDIRQKAERNFSVVAGNSGSGGMLLENRSVNITGQYGDNNATLHAGITLKSAFAISMYASQLGVKAEVDISLISGGKMWLDSAVYTNATRGSILEVVGAENAPRDRVATRLMTKSKTIVSTSSIFGGSMQIVNPTGQATLIVEGNVIGGGRGVFRRGANFLAISNWNIPYSEFEKAIEESKGQGVTAVGDFKAVEHGNQWADQAYYDIVGFSFRSSASYGLDGFEVVEARWQQKLRAGGGTGAWKEPVVTSTADGGIQTKPVPGFEFDSAETYVKVDMHYIDILTGKPTAGPYENKTPDDVVSRAKFDTYSIG